MTHKRKTPRAALAVALYMALTNQLSGANAVNIYCGPIAAKSVSFELALLIPAFTQFVKSMSALSAAFLLRKFGRKTLLLTGLSFLILALLFIGTGFVVK